MRIFTIWLALNEISNPRWIISDQLVFAIRTSACIEHRTIFREYANESRESASGLSSVELGYTDHR